MVDDIRIYPGFNALYYSYYLMGLFSTSLNNKYVYTTHGFPKFHHHCLCFTCKSDHGVRRYYISAGDGTGINETGYDWCDVYAKVNFDPETTPKKYHKKILAIGPSFGIRYLTLTSTVIQAFITYIAGRQDINNWREHFANYYRQLRYRLPLDYYIEGGALKDYIFFVASLWTKEHEVNRMRANFIEASKSISGIQFEGGFALRRGIDVPGYDVHKIHKRYPLKEYLEKTKKSVVAFNSPAVQKCLGWKLAEFLALGKAIISTPLTRKLPSPLIHGLHIHIVDGSIKSIIDAINHINQDEVYRKKLEAGARNYYLSNLYPNNVISRVFSGIRQQ